MFPDSGLLILLNHLSCRLDLVLRIIRVKTGLILKKQKKERFFSGLKLVTLFLFLFLIKFFLKGPILLILSIKREENP